MSEWVIVKGFSVYFYPKALEQPVRNSHLTLLYKFPTPEFVEDLSPYPVWVKSNFYPKRLNGQNPESALKRE